VAVKDHHEAIKMTRGLFTTPQAHPKSKSSNILCQFHIIVRLLFHRFKTCSVYHTFLFWSRVFKVDSAKLQQNFSLATGFIPKTVVSWNKIDGLSDNGAGLTHREGAKNAKIIIFFFLCVLRVFAVPLECPTFNWFVYEITVFFDTFFALSKIKLMITTVTGKNQVTIPAKLAKQLGIQPGARIDRSIGEEGVLIARLLPPRAELARQAAGMGHEWLVEGRDPIAELIQECVQADEDEGLV
jgi:AbrB family looped-hinge helix DNA binding protein